MIRLLALFRGWLFRTWGRLCRRRVDLGTGLELYVRLRLEGPGRITIGRNCVVRGIPGDPSQYVTIDTHATDAQVSIGDCATLCAARISARFAVSAGDNLIIEESSIVDTDFHSLARDRGRPEHENASHCRIAIGNNVLIGARSVVTKGVMVGDNAIVAPGSVVTSSVAAGSVVAGNPARPRR